MQQHPVPQNVTGFQFKLIGDMTVKQFVYLAAGTLLGYFITRLGWPAVIKFPMALGAFGAGFAFAFMPLEDRPLDRWVTTFFRNIYAPTIFLWRKSSDIPEILQPAVMKIPQNTSTTIIRGVSQETVSEYLRSLPQKNISPLDEKEQQQLTQISQSIKKEYGVLQVSDKLPQEISLSGITDRITQETTTPFLATAVSGSQKVIAVPAGNTTKIIPTVGRVKIRPLRQPAIGPEKTPEKSKKEDTSLESKPAGATKTPTIRLDINISQQKAAEQKIVNQTAENLTLEKNEPATVHVSFKTPVAKPAAQTEKATLSTDLQEKISKLEKDLENVSQDSQDKEKVSDKESVKLKDSLKMIEEKFAQTLSDKQKIEEELLKIKKEANVKKVDENVFVPNQMVEEKKETTTVKFVPSQMAAKVGVPQPTKANIVAGIVKDQTNDILPNVLIEIKDVKGKTERALKTNKLGQFSIATSLDNGIYTIHFEDPAGLHEFDIIEITLDGKIFPAMEVRAKNQKDTEREKLREALFGKQG